nr:hypothetical protein [Halomonas sp. TA22]
MRGDSGTAHVDPTPPGHDVDVASLGVAVSQCHGIGLCVKAFGSDVRAAGIDDMAGCEIEIATFAQGPVVTDTGGHEGIDIAAQGIGLQVDVALGDHRAGFAIGYLAIAGHEQSATGTQHAMVDDVVLAGQPHVAFGDDVSMVGNAVLAAQPNLVFGEHAPPIFDASVGLDDDLAGVQGSAMMYTDASLGGQEVDLAGIHAAQMRHVDGDFGRPSLALHDLHLLAIDIDPVSASGDFEFLGPDAGLDFDGTCQDRGVVAAAGIQAISRDPNRAFLDTVAGQITVPEFGTPSGQRGAAGVDEPRAIDMDTGGIGDDDLGTPPSDFHMAAQMAGITRVDLVDDHPGFAGGEIGIALHPAA